MLILLKALRMRLRADGICQPVAPMSWPNKNNAKRFMTRCKKGFVLIGIIIRRATRLRNMSAIIWTGQKKPQKRAFPLIRQSDVLLLKNTPPATRLEKYRSRLTIARWLGVRLTTPLPIAPLALPLRASTKPQVRVKHIG